MKKTVDAVAEGKMGYILAAKAFSVPQTTLERKVKGTRENSATSSSTIIKVSLDPKQPVFTEEENNLCSYILDMETRLYGFTNKNLKALAYNLAVKNNKAHPFNVQKQEAGKDWFQGFLMTPKFVNKKTRKHLCGACCRVQQRSPDLKIRKTESTSAARAAWFNGEAVNQFSNFLGNIYDEHQLTPDRIYNCNETGVSVVPKTKSKIVTNEIENN